MKPRDFLNFFKTKSGKLVLFVAIFGGGLMLFSALRNKSSSGDMDVRVTRPQTNATDKPQIVQTVERPMQPFHPPPPKPEPPPPPAKTNEPPKVVAEKPKPEPPPAALAPISLFADSAAGVVEPKDLGSVYAPFGRLISCETVVTVDSASIQTPIIGLVTENVYHAGRLIIPAGTEVHGTAQTDRHRERIASGGSWTLVWQTTAAERCAQLVFCDLSTPKDKGFSVYCDMAEKLEQLGVPTREIAFIQDYDSDASKLALFRDVRAGKVRVLFGSTQKMGSGTNVQERLIALHHLDAPWRPADVEQREGRILRQGNKNTVVSVFRYVSEGSFDAYMWQTLETKAKFIAQVMSGDMTIRRLEDLDSAALTYAEVKAIASGNPLVIEKAQVDAELIRLTRLRSAHAEEQYRIRTNLRRSHEDAETFTARLANLRQDITARQDTSGDKFTIELDGQTLDNRGIAGELIVRRAEKIKNRFGDDVRIGHFAGFDLFLRPGFNNAVEVVLRGKNSYGARVSV
jgi:hypothetical protein